MSNRTIRENEPYNGLFSHKINEVLWYSALCLNYKKHSKWKMPATKDHSLYNLITQNVQHVHTHTDGRPVGKWLTEVGRV